MNHIRPSTIAALAAFAVGLALAALATPPAPQTLAPERPQRIVCLAPSATESVFALGAGHRVVGVTDYCTTPPEAATRTRLGGTFNPNLERLLALRPDLVIVQGRAGTVDDFCRARGIPLLTLEMANVESVLHDLQRLGRALDCQPQAHALTASLRAELAAIQTALADKPRPRVFLSLYRTGGSLSALTTATRETYLGELIQLAGGQNVFAELPRDYPQVSREALLRRQVEVIIEPVGSAATSPAEQSARLADWARLGPLPAVANRRIHFPPGDALLRPGPRLAEAARTLAGLIHPEPPRD